MQRREADWRCHVGDHRAHDREQVVADRPGIRCGYLLRATAQHRLDEQLLLRDPSPVNRRLMDTRSPRDACDGRGTGTVLGELIECCGQHSTADVFTAAMRCGCAHHASLSQVHLQYSVSWCMIC